jgi:hypothetical protein
MDNNAAIELKNIDPEDVSDVIMKVGKSFNLKFKKNDFDGINTFGSLCDMISNKMEGDNLNDCTTQQAFYKLRNAIAVTLSIEKDDITPGSVLQTLYPVKGRRLKVAMLEKELGFKITILRPKHWITGSLFLMSLASIASLFFFWQAGLIALFFSIAGFTLTGKMANEFDLQNIGEVAGKISREHYFKARRNSGTVNRREVVRKITAIFSSDLELNEQVLTSEATFI